MKIVRPICCGMDVHKNIIVATIGITNKKTRITEYIQETFSTLNSDLLNLKQWLINHKCFDACMESTGKYWIPIFNILEDETYKFRKTHTAVEEQHHHAVVPLREIALVLGAFQ